MKAKHAVLPLAFLTFLFLFLFCEYIAVCHIFGPISLASSLGRDILLFSLPVPITLGVIVVCLVYKFTANSEKIKLGFWIFLIATPIVLACYFGFKIAVGNNTFAELKMAYKLERHGSVDLADFVKDFDFIVITDEGDYLSRYGFEDNVKSERLAQTIHYYKDGKIIKQIILSLYISEPEDRVYLFFFNDNKPVKYCIKAEKGNTVFVLENKSHHKIANFYCLKNSAAEKIY